MADTALSNVIYTVPNNVQTGLESGVFFHQSEVDTISLDASTREVSAITMKTGKQGYTIDFEDAQAVVKFNMTGGTNSGGTQELTFSLNGVSAENRKALVPLDKNTGLCFLGILYNGERVLCGVDIDTSKTSDVIKYRSKYTISGEGSSSGTVKDSGDAVTNQYLRNYGWRTNNDFLIVDKTLDLTVLLAPAV